MKKKMMCYVTGVLAASMLLGTTAFAEEYTVTDVSAVYTVMPKRCCMRMRI